MDLAELKFKVDTKELDDALKGVNALGTAVAGLNQPMQKLSDNSHKVAKAVQDAADSTKKVANDASTAAKSIGGVDRVIAKAAESMRILRDEEVQAADGIVKLGEGFTKAQSNMLAHIKLLGATSDQMKELAHQFKQYNDIAGINTFDKSASGLAKMRKEVAELTKVNELMSQGLALTREEIVLLSRDLTAVSQKYKAGSQELVKAQKEVQDQFIKTAHERNILIQQAKESQVQADREAKAIAERAAAERKAVEDARRAETEKIYGVQRLNQLRKEEEEKTSKAILAEYKDYYSALEKATLEGEREIQAIKDRMRHEETVASYRAQGYSAASSRTAARLQDQGVPKETINSYLLQAQAQEKAARAAMEKARATEYLIDVEARLDLQLAETSGSMRQRYTDQLLKVKRAVELTGGASVEATAHLTKLENKIRAVADKEHRRELENLGRAISVQMGDVGVSLAGGMNPLLVMIQQGDQIRGLLQQIGGDAKTVQSVMMTAAGQIGRSFVDTGKALGSFVTGAIFSMGRGIADLGASALFLKGPLEKAKLELEAIEKAGGKASLGLMAVKASFGFAGAAALTAVAALALYTVESFKIMNASRDLNVALITQGAKFGLSRDSARAYAETLTETNTNTLDVMRTMTAVAKSEVGAQFFGETTKAVMQFSKYTGEAVDSVLAKFNQIKSGPSEALSKLAEDTGLVRIETLAQVRALELQGDRQKAVNLATEEYNRVLRESATRAKDSLTGLEKLWLDIKDAINGAKQAAYDFANSPDILPVLQSSFDVLRDTVGSVFGFIERSIVRSISLAQMLGIVVDTMRNGPTEEKRTSLFGYMKDFFYGKREETSTPKSDAQQKAQTATERQIQLNAQLAKSEADFFKIVTQNQGKLDKQASEFKQLEIASQSYINNLIATNAPQKLINEAYANMYKAYKQIKEKNKDKDKSREKIINEEARAIERANKYLADQSLKISGVTEAERELAKVKNDKDWDKYSERTKKDIEAKYNQAAAIQYQAKIEEEYFKQVQELEKIRERDDATRKSIVTEQRKMNEALEEETARLEQEIYYLGASEEIRKRQMKLFDLEIAKKKELRDLDVKFSQIEQPTQADYAAWDRYRQEIADRYDQKMRNINSELAFDYAKKMKDEIDSLSKGVSEAIATALFEGGKAGRQKLRDVVVAKLREKITLQIDAFVNVLMNQAAGFISGALGLSQAGGGSAGGGTSVLGYANNVQGVANMYKYGSALYNNYQANGLMGMYNNAVGGYNAGGIKGAWDSLFAAGGASSGLAAGGGAAANIGGTYAGAVLGDGSGAAIANASAGTSAAGGSALSYAGWAALIYLGVKKAMGDYDEGFRSEGARGIQDEVQDKVGGFYGDFLGFVLGGVTAEFSNLGKKMGLSDKWADILSGATGAAKLFGRAIPKIEGRGVEGSFGGGEFTGQAYIDTYAKGGIFRKSKWETHYAKMSDDMQNFLNEVSGAVMNSVKEYGSILSLSTDQLTGVSTKMKIEFFGKEGSEVDKLIAERGENLDKLSKEYLDAVEKDQQKVMEAIGNSSKAYAEALIDSFGPQVEKFKIYGETTLETLERLSKALGSMNQVMKLAGFTEFEKSLAGADLAGKFAEYFGGLDAAANAISSYFESIFSEEDKLARKTQILKDAFKELNVTMPDTREAFRALVEATQAAGDSKLLASLIQLAPAFAEITQVVEKTLLTMKDVIDNFSGVADKLLNEEQLKTFKVSQVRSALGDAGIDVTDEIIRNANATQVFDAALQFFNQGLYEKANAIIDIVDLLTEINPSGFYGYKPDKDKEESSPTSGRYQSAREAVEKAFDDAMSMYDKNISSIDDQISAIEKESDARRDSIKDTENAIKDLQNSIGDIAKFKEAISKLRKELYGTVLGPNKVNIFAELMKAVNSAKSGNLDSLDDISNYSKQYVDYAKESSSTYLDYVMEMAKVQNVLREVEGSTQSQVSGVHAQIKVLSDQLVTQKNSLTTSEDQLAELRKQKAELESQKQLFVSQYEQLMDINQGVQTLAAKLDAFNSAKNTMNEAAKTAVTVKGGKMLEGSKTYNATDAMDYFKELYSWGYSPDEIRDYTVENYGADVADINYFAKLAGIPGFATGGNYHGGLAVVGETGREVINFDRPGMIYNASQTKELLTGSSDASSSEETALLRTLIQLVSNGNLDLSKVRKILEGVTPERDSIKVSNL